VRVRRGGSFPDSCTEINLPEWPRFFKTVKHMQRILITALSIFSCTAAFADEAKPNLAIKPELHAKTEGRINKFNEISKQGEAKLVFLGDSITQGWEGNGKEVWKAEWEKYKAANFGIGGDRTEHVLWRMDNGNFDGLKPKLVVVMIGTNNTGHRKGAEPAADTAAGVKAILDKLAAKCPDAKVLVLGIFPRGAMADDKLRVHNAAINEHIAKMADGQKVHYMDIAKSFLQPDGSLPKEIMPDLLHLSPKGYQLWADAIKEKVAELMK
jgi:lysophospholipase L1-like esterase